MFELIHIFIHTSYIYENKLGKIISLASSIFDMVKSNVHSEIPGNLHARKAGCASYRSVNFKSKFSCSHLNQKTNEIIYSALSI